jgi:Ca-activated chloride channel family protein
MHRRSNGKQKSKSYSHGRLVKLLHLTVSVALFAGPQVCKAQSEHGTAAIDKLNAAAIDKLNVEGEFAGWPRITQEVQFVDGNSIPVNGLLKNQVVVSEDGFEQSDVILKQDDEAASICLLLDVSSSMKESGKAIMEAARKLIETANPNDEFAIFSFSFPAYVEQWFTTDRNKFDAVFQRLEFKGSSALFDAVSASVDQMETHVGTHAFKRRKIIVVFSDGDNNSSGIKLEGLLRRLRYPGAPLIYSLSPPSAQEAGLRNLLAITEETGGFSFAPKQLSFLNDNAAEISRDIHSRYSLEYTSTHSQRDGKLHKVEIKVTPRVNASGVKPYFRQEYYAPSH